VRLCDVASIDPIAAANEKIDSNASRFPPGDRGPR
jgi:hypothetical protein